MLLQQSSECAQLIALLAIAMRRLAQDAFEQLERIANKGNRIRSAEILFCVFDRVFPPC
jgi:hypothetical protein